MSISTNTTFSPLTEEEIREKYMSPSSDLPIINPVQLPCGDIIERAQACALGILKGSDSEQGPYETKEVKCPLCEKSVTSFRPLPNVKAALKAFLNQNSDTFGGNFKDLQAKIRALFPEAALEVDIDEELEKKRFEDGYVRDSETSSFSSSDDEDPLEMARRLANPDSLNTDQGALDQVLNGIENTEKALSGKSRSSFFVGDCHSTALALLVFLIAFELLRILVVS